MIFFFFSIREKLKEWELNVLEKNIHSISTVTKQEAWRSEVSHCEQQLSEAKRPSGPATQSQL